MPAALAAATREQTKALVAHLVESVETSDRKVCGITIVPAARVLRVPDFVYGAPGRIQPPTPALGRLRSIH